MVNFYAWKLPRFINITQETVINFSVGFFEGVIITNITSSGSNSALVETVSEETKELIQQKTKKVLVVAAGGAISKAAPTLAKIALTVSGATPNLLI